MFDKAIFTKALRATANHRGTAEQIADISAIVQNIAESVELKVLWEKYRKQFAYAESIAYEQIIDALKVLLG